jgi:putative endonuclease
MYWVYMLASRKHGTIYVGVTNDLIRRVYQHKNKLIKGFTKEYAVTRLVWFETHDDITAAIMREKELKKWRREWKINLIERDNPHWDDLYAEITG